MIPWLVGSAPFPPLESALAEPNGLLAVGGDLSPGRLLEAYRQGIYPWFNPGEPILWWSPDPRMVLYPDAFKIARSLARRLKRPDYAIRVDTAFTQVMQGCAEPRAGQAGTWITPEMQAAYGRLHAAGYAHSVETWLDDRLVAGLYGVALGRAFFGESMFTRISDGSKLALAHLVLQLKRWGFGLIDCQMVTRHLASLGARPIARAEFRAQLERLTAEPGRPGKWTFDHDLVARTAHP